MFASDILYDTGSWSSVTGHLSMQPSLSLKKKEKRRKKLRNWPKYFTSQDVSTKTIWGFRKKKKKHTKPQTTPKNKSKT